MQIVINISDEIYKRCRNYSLQCGQAEILEGAVAQGAPLPKGHGRLIDADHMIARLEAASKFYDGENADAFDERFSHGLKEAAIKVAEEPTIIEADKTESEVDE